MNTKQYYQGSGAVLTVLKNLVAIYILIIVVGAPVLVMGGRAMGYSAEDINLWSNDIAIASILACVGLVWLLIDRSFNVNRNHSKDSGYSGPS